MLANKTAARFFDGYVDEIDALYSGRGPLVRRLINHWFRKSCLKCYRKTLETCEPITGKSVMDVGCGPGHYAVALAQKGARKILGIDISPAMIARAREHARSAGVGNRCEFVVADFATYQPTQTFDFAVAQGILDYLPRPDEMVDKILAVTKNKAFFSFPRDRGLLAWQRRVRYFWKCDLFLYSRRQSEKLLSGLNHGRVKIESIGRDFFVTVNMEYKYPAEKSTRLPGLLLCLALLSICCSTL